MQGVHCMAMVDAGVYYRAMIDAGGSLHGNGRCRGFIAGQW